MLFLVSIAVHPSLWLWLAVYELYRLFLLYLSAHCLTPVLVFWLFHCLVYVHLRCLFLSLYTITSPDWGLLPGPSLLGSYRSSQRLQRCWWLPPFFMVSFVECLGLAFEVSLQYLLPCCVLRSRWIVPLGIDWLKWYSHPVQIWLGETVVLALNRYRALANNFSIRTRQRKNLASKMSV